MGLPPNTGYSPFAHTQSMSNADWKSVLEKGHRSQYVRTPNRGDAYNNAQLKKVKYNGWWFPPGSKIRTTFVPEYDASRRTVKYITLAVTVEAILTPTDLGGYAVTQNTDGVMKEIYSKLTEPGRPMEIQGVGTGGFYINCDGQGDLTEKNYYQDLDYGPKPQVTDWEPLGGGMACRIQWLCVTRISPCNYFTIDGIVRSYSDLFWFEPDLIDSGVGFVEFAWETDWSYDESGFLQIQNKGKLEIALIRNPDSTYSLTGNRTEFTSDNVIDLAAISQKFEFAKQRLKEMFPTREGFRRKENFSITQDKKVLNFEFNDEEIRSPQGLPAGAMNFDLQESLSTGIKEGFNVWTWRLTGDITVPKSSKFAFGINATAIPENKRLCFLAFYQVLMDRLNRVKAIASQSKDQELPKDAVIPNLQPDNVDYGEIYFIPQKIDITNEVFGVGMTIDISYTIVCPSSLILAASGMFDTVRAPGFTWAEWKAWLENTKVIPDTIADKLPDKDYVVDFCHPLNPIPWKSYEKYDEDGNPPQDSLTYRMDEKAGDKTFVEYYNEFEVKTYHNTDMSAAILDNISPSTETASSATNRKNKFVAIGNYNPSELLEEYSEGGEPINPILLSSHSNPVTIITMKGRATRVGLPANPPKLLSVSGRPVVRYGEDKIATSSKTIGAVLGDFANPVNEATKETKVTSLYRTVWEKSYIVNGVPEAAIMETTGKPEFYS